MNTSRSSKLAIIVAIVGGLTACSDNQRAMPTEAVASRNNGAMGIFHRYVAIGTSISAGVQGDGLIAATQATSWPAQLTAMAGRELTQPYIDGTGCRSPLVGPLASGARLSGEAAGTDASFLSCSPLRADVTLPTANVALNGALTRDALFTTPENITDAGNAGIYQRVLPPGATQVSLMTSQNPKLVSVELGGNEVLNARSGIAIPGATLFPVAAWQPLYDALLDKVGAVTKMAVIVGLIDDVRHLPALRSGDEIWQDRNSFLGFNVVVSNDCQGSENSLFVPVRIPTAVATGVYYAQHGFGQYTLSCAAGPSTAQDFTLTPAEVAIVNGQMHTMTAHIRSEATRRGYAYFALGDLYDLPGIKPPFSVAALMGGPAPYGQYVSLDGVHPSAAGQTVLARAAARALNATYAMGLPE